MHLFERSFWSALWETISDRWKTFDIIDIVVLILSLIISSPVLIIYSFCQIIFKGD